MANSEKLIIQLEQRTIVDFQENFLSLLFQQCEKFMNNDGILIQRDFVSRF